jgi:hypothetical protein
MMLSLTAANQGWSRLVAPAKVITMSSAIAVSCTHQSHQQLHSRDIHIDSCMRGTRTHSSRLLHSHARTRQGPLCRCPASLPIAGEAAAAHRARDDLARRERRDAADPARERPLREQHNQQEREVCGRCVRQARHEVDEQREEDRFEERERDRRPEEADRERGCRRARARCQPLACKIRLAQKEEGRRSERVL